MSRTYKVIGINLQSHALGESDKIVTVLTENIGVIRVVASGVSKHNSSLGGRVSMFVVNELLISKGRSLDRIIQAETIKCYPELRTDLCKLAAAQYLGEIVLSEAVSEQPQTEVYRAMNQHLERLAKLTSPDQISIYAELAHGVFHFLSLAGLMPQVQICCLSQKSLKPDLANPHWRVGFSVPGGGTVCLEALASQKPISAVGADYQTIVHQQELPIISCCLDAIELTMLQNLSQPELTQMDTDKNYSWFSVEKILRQYAQYYLGRPIHSATLIDSYFATKHDATL